MGDETKLLLLLSEETHGKGPSVHKCSSGRRAIQLADGDPDTALDDDLMCHQMGSAEMKMVVSLTPGYAFDAEYTLPSSLQKKK